MLSGMNDTIKTSTFIQVFKSKTKYSRLYLGICLGLVVLGVAGLVFSLISQRQLLPLLNHGAYFALIFNGIISFLMVRDSLRKARYFVSWNQHEICYLLPKNKEPEVIRLADVSSVEISQGKVSIGLRSGENKLFKLNYFFFPERKTLIDFFEALKRESADTITDNLTL